MSRSPIAMATSLKDRFSSSNPSSPPPPPYTATIPSPEDPSIPLTIPNTIVGLEAFHALPESPVKTNAILHELLDLSEKFSSLSAIITATNNAGRGAATQEPLLQILNMRLALKRIGEVARGRQETERWVGSRGSGGEEGRIEMGDIRRVEMPRISVHRGRMLGVYWMVAREFGRGILRARRAL